MTIEDIAKLANTSVATVSRVINNDMHVSPATRKRVQKVIAENDYRPNFAGKNLRQNKTYQLLAVLPTITNPFFSRVIEGLSDTADQNGYSLTFVVSDRDVKKEKSYLDRLMSKVVDGMVLFYPSIDAKTIESYSKNYPVVCIGTTGTSKVSRAGINDFEAAREAIDYLIGLGHRRIALLSDMQPLAFNAERERGCRAAMSGAGLELPENMILRCSGKKNAAELVEELMKRPDPPTAVFSFSDTYAIPALKHLTDLGFKVGEEIDIMGFDNIEFAQFVTPSLTTVSQPGYQLGESAFKLLLEKMEDINTISKEIVFPHEIVIRDSTSKNMRP